MLHLYFDFWTNFWRRVAAPEPEPEPGDGPTWIVQFGSVEKLLDEIHRDTGLPALIAPFKCRIERALSDLDRQGLAVVFRIDRQLGLVHILRGPNITVANATMALSRSSQR
jgi:hypothetical protein